MPENRRNTGKDTITPTRENKQAVNDFGHVTEKNIQ